MNKYSQEEIIEEQAKANQRIIESSTTCICGNPNPRHNERIHNHILATKASVSNNEKVA